MYNKYKYICEGFAVSRYLSRFKRDLLLILMDGVALAFSCFLSYFIVNSFLFIHLNAERIFLDIIIFVCFNLIGLILCNVYRNIWRYATIRDFFGCIMGLVIGTAAYYITMKLMQFHNSEVYSLISFALSVCGIVILRTGYSYIYAHLKKDNHIEGTVNVLIAGGGDACQHILYEIRNNNRFSYNPVGIVDDDPQKQGRKIYGVTILGMTEQIPQIVKEKDVNLILIAMPSADHDTKKRISAICSKTSCDVKILPYVHELIMNGDLLAQVKPIKVEDLLGRDVITFDDKALSALISDKVCMVTGGGGSIGSELCRQIAKYHPRKLVIVDIYENNAYDIQMELTREYGDKLDLYTEIASVRDKGKMRLLFQEYRPNLVFHAAAHKHVPLMETNPEESVKNNVNGTFITAMLAEEFHTDKFVLVSTDKAVNPTNVMGATKRCCEMIVQYMAQKITHTDFIAVRFGNVLGSNGSVIPLFEKQIAEGGPVTVTDPEIIRYFMTIPEAVSLILQAANMARGGEIFVLDMGEPVKILTLAENLIKLHKKKPYEDIDIVFTGLRPGEKLYEELLMAEENLRETENKKIFIGQQIVVEEQSFLKNLQTLHDYAEQNDKEQVLLWLSKIVPTFHHNCPECKKKVV